MESNLTNFKDFLNVGLGHLYNYPVKPTVLKIARLV